METTRGERRSGHGEVTGGVRLSGTSVHRPPSYWAARVPAADKKRLIDTISQKSG